MEPTTIFQTLSLDRARVQWESYLDDLTPIQHGSTVIYKRDDLWAPLGVGGINGFKVRQGAWLMTTILRDAPGVIFGGSVKSTQHAMVATVARHYGKRSLHVLGATTEKTCLRHESVAIARDQGAELEFISVAYTAMLQRRVRELQALHPGYGVIEYGVGLDHERWPLEQVRAYHEVGASQVANVPSHITDLVIPAGSCHAATSIVYGLAARRRLVHIHLVGIGPLRTLWLQARLCKLGVTLDFDFTLGKVDRLMGTASTSAWRVPVTYYDLVGSGYARYQDVWEETWDGIAFHRTYEAKVMRWLREHAAHLLCPMTLVWIVGAEPRMQHMQAWAVGAPLTASTSVPTSSQV